MAAPSSSHPGRVAPFDGMHPQRAYYNDMQDAQPQIPLAGYKSGPGTA